MIKKFQRKVEDFICEVCAARVNGNGYTNHCPNCLWSKHVDVNPGDRQNPCRGLMEPIGLDQKSGEFVIIHKCQRCGKTKRNKVSSVDNKKILARL